MTSVFRKRGRTIFSVNIPKLRGGWVPKSAGTRDKATATRMGRMVDDFTAVRAWDLLERITKGEITLPRMYDQWLLARGDLSTLRAEFDDVDIETMVKAWRSSLDGSVSKDTAEHYLHHVRTLIAEDKTFYRSSFTSERLQDWVDKLDAEPGTKRKAGAGVSSFATYLVRRKVIKSNPMRDVVLPPAAKPRIHYLDTPEAKKLADAQPGQFRNLSAFLSGSGADVSSAIAIRKRDVDVKHKEIRAIGTKAHNRDRIIRVADWVWDEYIVPLLVGKLPDARLFDEIPNRWAARDAHFDATTDLAEESPIFKGYTQKDARHTYAVRAIRSGTPPELVAKQLGHSNAVLVHKVYGRFAPSQQERDKWEKIATAADAERAAEAGK